MSLLAALLVATTVSLVGPTASARETADDTVVIGSATYVEMPFELFVRDEPGPQCRYEVYRVFDLAQLQDLYGYVNFAPGSYTDRRQQTFKYIKKADTTVNGNYPALTTWNNQPAGPDRFGVDQRGNAKLGAFAAAGRGNCADGSYRELLTDTGRRPVIDYVRDTDTEVGWYLPTTKLGYPTASFTSRKADSGAFDVEFTATSRDFDDQAMTHAWKLGDGGTATGASFTHTYPGPGPYTVELTTRDADNKKHTVTRTIEVGAEGLTGEIFRVVNDAGNVLNEGQGADMRIRVQNDGDVPLTDVSIDSITVTPTDPDELGKATFEPSTADDARRLTGVLGTESLESVDFADYRMEGIDEGTVTIAAAISGKEPDGTPVGGELTYDLTIKKAPLQVDVVLDPAELQIDERIEDQPAEGGTGEPAEPQETTATVTITNTDEETLTSVTIPAKVDVLGTDGAVVPNTRIRKKGGPRPADGIGPVDLGPFDLEPGESRAVEYTLEVLDDGTFEVQSTIQFSDGNEVRFAQGSAALEVALERVLGVKLSTELGDDLGEIDGGQIIRMTGNLYNFSSTDTLEVDLASLEPQTFGNANVFVYRPLEVQVDPKKCYLPTGKITIEPNGRFPIHGLLITSADGGTRGGVSFDVPDAIRITREEVRTEVPDSEKTLSPKADAANEQTALSFPYTVDTSVEVLPEWGFYDYSTFAGYFLYGAVLGGVEWMASNIKATAELLSKAASLESLAAGGNWLVVHALKGAEVYYKFWLFAGPVGRAEFIADVGKKVLDLSLEAGYSLQDAEKRKELAEGVLPGWFDQVENAYATNDPKLLGQAFGRVAGNVGLEVISCVMPSPKWEGKFAKLATAEAKVTTEAAELSGRLAAAGSKEAAKQTARASIKNGAFIYEETASTLWGTGADAYRSLREYAAKNKLLIHIRERTEGSIARLRQGFIEKMEHMKLKNVRPDLDKPLGYLDEHADIVAFKKPISQSELDDVLSNIADPDLRNEVANRYAKRVKEYDKWKPMYDSWVKNGFPASFEYGPNRATGPKGRTRIPFRLKEVKVGGNVVPDYTIPEVFIDGKWRGFTGDIDITDIRHANGRSLTADQARRVYDQMSKLDGVNLRHGDTIHWLEGLNPSALLKEKVNQLQAFFVGGPDKFLQFGPDGVRAVQIDPAKTFITTKAGSRASYATYEGGAKQALSQVEFAGGVLTTSESLPIVPWIAPADWAFGGENGELAECQPIVDAADGFIVRQEAEGALLEVFLDGTWQTFDTEACRAAGSARSMAGDSGLPRLVQAAGDATKTPLLVKPQSGLASLAAAGSNRVDVHDLRLAFGDEYVGDWFQAGDTIMLEPGTEREETHVITSISPLTTADPLRFSHDPDTMVTVFSRPASPLTPVTPTTPVTPAVPQGPKVPAAPAAPGTPSSPAATTNTQGTNADGDLARTGSDPLPIVGLGLALVLGGWATLRFGRRRRPRAA